MSWDHVKRVSGRDRIRRRPARYVRQPSLSGWQAARAKVRAKFASSSTDRWFVVGGPACTDTAFSVKKIKVVKYGDFWYTKGLQEQRGHAYLSEKAARDAAKKTVSARITRLETSLRSAKRNLGRLS